jgi:hypothetical protein
MCSGGPVRNGPLLPLPDQPVFSRQNLDQPVFSRQNLDQPVFSRQNLDRDLPVSAFKPFRKGTAINKNVSKTGRVFSSLDPILRLLNLQL